MNPYLFDLAAFIEMRLRVLGLEPSEQQEMIRTETGAKVTMADGREVDIDLAEPLRSAVPEREDE